MKLDFHQPTSIVWDDMPAEKIAGETGFALVKAHPFGQVQVRKIVYSENYLGDHWCLKGHVIHVLDGQLSLLHKGGKTHVLTSGMTFLVGDDSEAHMAQTATGATVLVID